MTRRQKLTEGVGLIARVTLFGCVVGVGCAEPPARAPRGTLQLYRAEPRQHVVRPGDTMDAIARQHDTTVEELTRLNPSLQARSLAVGSVVRLPSVKPPVRKIVQE